MFAYLLAVNASIHSRTILGSIVRNDRFGVEGYECEDRSVPKFLNTDFDNVVAILGAESSSVTIQVNIDRVVIIDYRYILYIYIIVSFQYIILL